jgi:hypothetical protein
MAMSAHRKDRCGTRTRRPAPESDGCRVPDGQEVGLTPQGRAMLDALRDDPRYAEILADPWGDHPVEP